jgi:hypothetical protein
LAYLPGPAAILGDARRHLRGARVGDARRDLRGAPERSRGG